MSNLSIVEGENLPTTIPIDAESRVESIKWAVATVACKASGLSTCLINALVAQKLLARQRIPGAIYIGVSLSRQEEGKVIFDAHAWLKTCGITVTGQKPEKSYAPLTTYTW